MNIKRSKFFFQVLWAVLFLFNVQLAHASPVKVVATQAFFADLVRQIGKEKVEVKAVAPPKFNVHFIQPRPSDVRNVARADLYVNAGLDLEAWSDPLLEAAGRTDLFRGAVRNLDLSNGIKLLGASDRVLSRAEGDIHLFGNPHFQMNPENAKIMAHAISEKLKELDPGNGLFYEENEKAFLSKLDLKIADWKTLSENCAGEEVISYHDDFIYLADFAGLKALQFLEPKPGIPPTPRHLEFLENYIRQNKIKAVILPTYYPSREAEALSKRTGIKLVTICQNVGEIPGTEDLFIFFDHNFKQLSQISSS